MLETNQPRLTRVWAMPHRHTFKIKPVHELLARLVGNGVNWADPFANEHSPAEHTNDINPALATKYHLDAVAFLNLFSDGALAGVLLDPPYSMHQVTVSYGGFGGGRVNALTPVYDEVLRVLQPGGYGITFGWNSNGLSRKRGFEIQEVIIIPHGGHHNDTIVTVERKT